MFARAGASVHATYPLASALGNSLAAWIETLGSEHPFRVRLNRIVDVYGTVDNFEDILTDLMTCCPGSLAAALPTTELPCLRDDLKEAVREYFDTLRTAPAPLYDQLALHVLPGDVVVTYNYDLGIERALGAAGLWDIRTGYGFSVCDEQQPSPVRVLKLHGSTNWRALLFGDHTGFSGGHHDSLGPRPVLFFQSDQEYLGFPDFVDPRCVQLDTAPSLPVMIMPALPKKFYFDTSFGQELKSFWNGLWDQAHDAIKQAEELVIIGYSMPTADERALELLLGTINKAVRLTICCGGATTHLERKFHDHGFSDIQHISEPTFEGFLAHQTTP